MVRVQTWIQGLPGDFNGLCLAKWLSSWTQSSFLWEWGVLWATFFILQEQSKPLCLGLAYHCGHTFQLVSFYTAFISWMIDIVFPLIWLENIQHPKHKKICYTFPFCIFFHFVMIKKIEEHDQWSFNDFNFSNAQYALRIQSYMACVCSNNKITRNDLFCTYTSHQILFLIQSINLWTHILRIF